MRISSALFDVIKILERSHSHFWLERTRPDTIRIQATLVGERLEIDVFEDNHIEISRFQESEAAEEGMELLLQIVRVEDAGNPA